MAVEVVSEARAAAGVSPVVPAVEVKPEVIEPVGMVEPRPSALEPRLAVLPVGSAASGLGESAVVGELASLRAQPAEVVVSVQAVAAPGG